MFYLPIEYTFIMKKLFLLCTSVLVLASFSYSQTTPAKPTLNHIAVYVVNLKTSTEFYQHIIGLDTIPEPFHDGKHTWFSIGPKSHLHLISGAAAATPHDKNSHTCFTVASIQDFIKTLDARHIEFENWAGEKHAVTQRVDGVQQIYFKDPDGYWIEINDARQ